MNTLLIRSVLGGAVLLGLLVVFGLRAILLRDTRKATRAEGIAHGGTAMVAIWAAYFIIPFMKKLFEDFEPELPALPLMVISLSDLVVNYWYIAILFGLIPGVLVDVLTFRYFHRNPETRFAARAMSLVISLLMLGQALLATLGIALAFTKLLNAIQ